MVNEIVYIDKTALEDAINFQLIDFKIIDGYYFDQGRNDKINETIRHLYDLRKNLKKKDNPIISYTLNFSKKKRIILNGANIRMELFYLIIKKR